MLITVCCYWQLINIFSLSYSTLSLIRMKLTSSIGIFRQSRLGQAAFNPFLILSDLRIILNRKPSPNFLNSVWLCVVANQPIVSSASFWNSWIHMVGSSTGSLRYCELGSCWVLGACSCWEATSIVSAGSQQQSERIWLLVERNWNEQRTTQFIY